MTHKDAACVAGGIAMVVAALVAIALQHGDLAAKERACYAQGLYPHEVGAPRDIVCMPLPRMGR